MAKWADYLISEVKYSPDHTRITQFKQHEDNGDSVGPAKVVDRSTVASNLKKGLTYKTVYTGTSGNWQPGRDVKTFITDGDYFIRTDDNKVKSDNLGELPEF